MGNELNCCKENNYEPYKHQIESRSEKLDKINYYLNGNETVLYKMNNPLIIYDNSIRNSNNYHLDTHESKQKTRNNIADFKPINLNYGTQFEDAILSMEDNDRVDIPIKEDYYLIGDYQINSTQKINQNTRNQINIKAENIKEFTVQGGGLDTNFTEFTSLYKTKDTIFKIKHLKFEDVVSHIKSIYNADVSNFMKEHLLNQESKFKKMNKNYCIKKAPLNEETIQAMFPDEEITYCCGKLYNQQKSINKIKSVAFSRNDSLVFEDTKKITNLVHDYKDSLYTSVKDHSVISKRIKSIENDRLPTHFVPDKSVIINLPFTSSKYNNNLDEKMHNEKEFHIKDFNQSEIDIKENILLSTKNSIFFSEQYIYWGEINLKGKKHGFGTLLFSNGVKYEGFWINDSFDLFGRKIDLDGTISEGFFKKGKLNGKGIQQTLISYYEGNFKDDLKSGFGQLTTDNEQYVGNFIENMKNGSGKLTFLLTDNIYEGSFCNDKIEGKGKYIWSFGDVYVGEFANGLLHGYGVYSWSNGDEYQGNYVKGVRSGFGKLKNFNGNTYEGDFFDNVPHGKGILTRSGKEPTNVLFQNGIQIKKELQIALNQQIPNVDIKPITSKIAKVENVNSPLDESRTSTKTKKIIKVYTNK